MVQVRKLVISTDCSIRDTALKGKALVRILKNLICFDSQLSSLLLQQL